jgi:alanine racemase
MRVAAIINPAALAHNLGVVRQRVAGSHIYAVVKADAYGHGLKNTVAALAEADAFAVACMDEVLELRAIDSRPNILVLEGIFDGRELAAAKADKLEIVVHADWQLQLLERDGAEGIRRVWAKFDTGMHRLGFTPESADNVRARLVALGIETPGVMSHLACADKPGLTDTTRQTTVFNAVCERFPGSPASLANSAGVLLHPNSHLDWVRPGLMLYGVSPLPEGNGTDFGLRPAMTLSAHLLSIQDVTMGNAVGYGATWQAPRDCRIGIVSIGYGDGYPWCATAAGEVLVRGKRVPLAGRVSMDMLGVDLTTLPTACVGDEVILWGVGLPVEEVARAVGTSPYELMCRVSRRVPRHIAGQVGTPPIKVSA